LNITNRPLYFESLSQRISFPLDSNSNWTKLTAFVLEFKDEGKPEAGR
jgi:hypothetical protein